MNGGPTTSAECDRLAAELSGLRERTGLSLAALAERTPYSKSSWQRYLNGQKPVPENAVVSLCALAREPAGRLLALWELADLAWSGRADAGPGAAAPTAGGPPQRAAHADPPRRRRVPLVAAAVAVMAGAAALLGTALLGTTPGGEGAAGAAALGGTETTTTPQAVPACHGAACDGKTAMSMGCGYQGMIVTVGSFMAVGGQRLELRQGRACGTVWVRATGLRVGDEVVLTVPKGRPQHVGAVGPDDSRRYLATPMVAAADPGLARVCLSPGRGGDQECFG